MPITPAKIQSWLDENMHKLDLGVQFLGDEPNAVRRDWDTAAARWCLVASWPYEAAAGNQSIPAVYKSIHDHHSRFLCDRFYLPATPGDMRIMERNDIPVFGIESKRPITDFDVVATSISYPVLSMSFIKMLTMSDIKPRWRDREPNTSPMVMVGGLGYGAPEVLAPVVDCWFLGEVEDEPGNPGIGAVTARIAAFKTQGRWLADRIGCYQDLAREFNFLYFPRFVDVRYKYEDRTHVGVGPHASKQVVAYTSLLDGMRLPLRKRHVKDLDAIAPLDNPPLLYADPAMGSGDLEVARSCPAWCSFCSLAWRSKPYRQRTVPYIVDYAKNLQDNLGSTRMAPFSPDLPMFTQRRHLVSELLEKVNDEVDAPSMRVDDFNADHQFILLQVHGGMDAVTLGVEGNSQRMRDLVGKGTNDADIKEAVTRGIRAGIRKFKLFMISNLPGEDEGDVYRILKLAKELADIRDSMGQSTVRIQFSWTPLMIEANTPFQWFAPQPASRILGDVWEEFRDLKIDFKLGAKALSLDAPVLTSSGFVPMGSLKVGSQLADPEGTYSEVTGVFPQGVKPVFRLTFSDGSTAEATDDHLWTIERWFVRLTGEGRNQESYRRRETVTTSRLRELLKQSCYPPHVVNSLGLASFDIAEADLPVHPYVLGLMLGDGSITQGTPRFTTADPELVYAIEQFHPELRAVQSPGKAVDWCLTSGGNRWNPNPLTESFKQLGIWGKRAWEKAVPELYKNASAKTRLAVLQGLMDTDGTGRDRRSASFTSTSEQLRDDVVWLARSLGLVAKPLAGKRSFCAGKEGRTAYQASIWETEETRIFRLQRKIRPLGRPKHRVLKTIEYVRDTETQCITVSAPSKLFITNDFIPTHNSQPDKLAFFQLCQRASRDVGEALVDAMIEADQACWGGVPRTFKDTIEAKLKLHGFDNGYADCFDERYLHDMFGWEFIDTGVNPQLMWQTYVQMREFVEYTDSHTYDLNFDGTYHGSEWIARCEERCQGKTCGACDYTDLKQRTSYIRAVDSDVDISTVNPVDQHSQAVRIRIKATKNEALRFVGNDHWRFLVRRACFRATTRLSTEYTIAKRSIRFASDEVKYRDWTAGTDYLELAFTRPMHNNQIAVFLHQVERHLEGRMHLHEWVRHPVDAVTIRADVDLTLFEVEVEADYDLVEQRLTWWGAEKDVPMRLKIEGGYFAPGSETVNAKDYVEDIWTLRAGHRLSVRMLLKGRPNPYNIVAALMGKPSWLPYAKHPARRLDVFIAADRHQQDFLRPSCQDCGLGIPITLLDQPYHPEYCPRCLDEKDT
jgi:hypothetical protein